MQISPTVKQLLIINILFFLGTQMVGEQAYNYLSLFFFENAKFQYWQPLTHMFMHGDERHLIFNMLGLFFLGPMVESGLGPKRFLILYLSCGFFASFAQLSITQGAVLGASGATYGVLAAFATMFPNMQLMLLFPPIPIKAKYMALGLIVIGLYSGMSGAQAGIAHFAHIGGALLGFILIKYWKMDNLR